MSGLLHKHLSAWFGAPERFGSLVDGELLQGHGATVEIIDPASATPLLEYRDCAAPGTLNAGFRPGRR